MRKIFDVFYFLKVSINNTWCQFVDPVVNITYPFMGNQSYNSHTVNISQKQSNIVGASLFY